MSSKAYGKRAQILLSPDGQGGRLTGWTSKNTVLWSPWTMDAKERDMEIKRYVGLNLNSHSHLSHLATSDDSGGGQDSTPASSARFNVHRSQDRNEGYGVGHMSI